MRSARHEHLQHELIDFTSIEPTDGFIFNQHLSVGPVTLTHCTSRPIEGEYLAASQVIIALHEGKAFEIEWRVGESSRIQSSTVSHGQAHIGDARLPFWVRHQASPSFFAIALDEAFVAAIWQKAFDRTGDFAIRTTIGIEDPVIADLGALGRRELSEGGAGGRLYLEGLATVLAVHLLRAYGTPERSPSPYRGGLAPRRVRRVLDYIDAHLTEDLGVVELAAIAELSPNHFGEAFKVSVGKSPHRYLTERRVHRAIELLHKEESSIAEIAQAVGFSSQSHLTVNFRRVTGLTPAQFRRSAG